MKALRKHYVDELILRQHNGLVKILTGIRRCGKSYLLSVLFKEYLLQQGVPEDHIIEVPLDRDDHRDLRDAIKLGEHVRSKIIPDGKWSYVFIDEIQLARRVLPPDIDLSRSFMAGDQPSDMEFAERAGLVGIRVSKNYTLLDFAREL